MADLHVKVKNEGFDPQSQNGQPGQSVKFKNDQNSEVTIELDSAFYDTSQIKVKSGDEKKVTIKSTAAGTGPFSTDKASTKKRETISGDIIIVPRK